MRYSIFALAAAITAVSAGDDCQATYNKCIAAGTPEVKCSCDLTTCSGEDAARIRDYCATATANLPTASAKPTAAPSTCPDGSAPIAPTIAQPQGQDNITACANSLELGATCGDDKQCKYGAECWGSNAGIIRACGNFNAGCKEDSQCAYNTCNNGLCNGFKASSSSSPVTAAATPSQTYACNPAHQYPGGVSCISTAGTLALVSPTPGFACNPAHDYGYGQSCISTAGTLSLVGPAATSAPAQTTGGAVPYYPVPTGTAGNATSVFPTGTAPGAPGQTTGVVPYTGDAVKTLSSIGAVLAGVAAFIL